MGEGLPEVGELLALSHAGVPMIPQWERALRRAFPDGVPSRHRRAPSGQAASTALAAPRGSGGGYVPFAQYSASRGAPGGGQAGEPALAADALALALADDADDYAAAGEIDESTR